MAQNSDSELDDKGNPEVIGALNKVYKPALTAFEEFHRQERRFKNRYGYQKMGKRYHDLTKHAHEIRHKVLQRIEELGGDADSSMEPVNVADGINDAYRHTSDRLGQLRDTLTQANAVAQSANDHDTHLMMLRLQRLVERKYHKVMSRRRQVRDMKDNYLLKA
jgi:hypothetical protein